MGRLLDRGGYTSKYYRLPFFFMITLKRMAGLPSLSLLDADAPYGVKCTEVTEALNGVLINFPRQSKGIVSSVPFRVMPDHIHLLIRVDGKVPASERLTLPQYVRVLRRRLTDAFNEVTGHQGEVFEWKWHDYVVKKKGQLANFRHYIINNAIMALARARRPDYFRIAQIEHTRLPERFWGLGNVGLLEYPELTAIKVSRSVLPETEAWEEEVEVFKEATPADVVVSCFFSRGEQAVRWHVLEQGGKCIVLLPNGFESPLEVAPGYFKWHPAGDRFQQACAEGRLLFLSRIPPGAGKGEKVGSLRARCLQMNALAERLGLRFASAQRGTPLTGCLH
jgi:REP element-mobilizing transposase RayT